jgi:hypothetical protein
MELHAKLEIDVLKPNNPHASQLEFILKLQKEERK